MMSAAAQARMIGANDRIRVGIIGPGGRGRYLMGEFKEFGAELAAVCDVYTANLEAGLKIANPERRELQGLSQASGQQVARCGHRVHARSLARKDGDRRGQRRQRRLRRKALAHKIEEGFAVIDAVRKTNRVVQVGMQRRSSELFLQGKSIMDSGQLGEVHLVTSQWLNHTANIRTSKLQGELDWNMWQGSAPKHELDPQRYFNWYYYYDYSGGLIVGQAAHIIDCIQWYMNSNGPLTVTCSGLKPDLPGVE